MSTLGKKPMPYRGSNTLFRKYIYDAWGKVAEIKDYPGFANGTSTYISKKYSYDELGRLTSSAEFDNLTDSVTKTCSYGYDRAGKVDCQVNEYYSDVIFRA
jgi:hypothetical protein